MNAVIKAHDFLVNRYAALFPMPEDTIGEMAEDIKANGLVHKIELYNNEIVDGRCRLAACKLAGVTPEYKEIVIEGGDLGLVKYVTSVNLKRRQLTTDQRAEIAAKMATLSVGTNQFKKKEGSSNEPGSGVTTKQAAVELGVSLATVKRKKAQLNPKPKPARITNDGQARSALDGLHQLLDAARSDKPDVQPDVQQHHLERHRQARPEPEAPSKSPQATPNSTLCTACFPEGATDLQIAWAIVEALGARWLLHSYKVAQEIIKIQRVKLAVKPHLSLSMHGEGMRDIPGDPRPLEKLERLARGRP